MRSKPSQYLFSIIDLAKWAPRITKMRFCEMNTYGRTNEMAELIVLSNNLTQKRALFKCALLIRPRKYMK
jgi:hypothetical protein